MQRQKNVYVHIQSKNQSIESVPMEVQTLYLVYKAILNMGKVLRNVFKELWRTMRMMSHQLENINNEIKIFKKDLMEILELKSTITKIKKSSEGLNSSFEQEEERIILCKDS